MFEPTTSDLNIRIVLIEVENGKIRSTGVVQGNFTKLRLNLI